MGLRELANLDSLTLRQRLNRRQIYRQLQKRHRYAIENADGQRLYYGDEESTHWGPQFCGEWPTYKIDIADRHLYTVLEIDHPFCWCLQTIKVNAPPGNTIGSIKERFTFCTPKYDIRNKNGDTILYVVGPCCPDIIKPYDGVFKIYSMTDEEVGTITRVWLGFNRPRMADADKYVATFPRHYDVETKALILGATFLIDFGYNEI